MTKITKSAAWAHVDSWTAMMTEAVEQRLAHRAALYAASVDVLPTALASGDDPITLDEDDAEIFSQVPGAAQ